jgi:hypothetical protein
MLPLILVLTSPAASADCFIHGMRPTVALPTTDSGQEFSFLASDDCETLRLSIRGTGLSWRPKSGGPAGPGPSTYRVVLTDEEWDQVVALSGSGLTWVVTGATSDGTVTRVSTTNELRVAVTRDLATGDAVLLGAAPSASTGWSLADVGDVDGDGQVDVLISAPDEAASAGVTYLMSGPVTGRMDLSDAATRFVGAAARDGAGRSIAGAGDVDADGYNDVIIGAPGYGPSGPGRDLGAAYLVLGPVTGTFDLSLADATFLGETQDDYAGGSVSSAGDMDGDGLPDLVVGAYGVWAGGLGCCTGAAYVMSGTRRGSHGLGTADALMYGEPSDRIGSSVEGLGDVDGDGLDDFLIGSYDEFERDIWAYGAGVSYVLFGPVSGRLDPSDADAKLVGGEDDHTYVGSLSSAAAGDVDADGLRDILLGAQYYGTAYLVNGGVTGTLWVGDADAKFVGEEMYNGTAWSSVSGAGDVDADGHDDILVGSSQNEDGGTDAGAAYLVRGPVTGSHDLAGADLKLLGAEFDDAGYAVSSAGDLDGDGRADILVGAPGHGARQSGAAYVMYGSGL